MELMLSFEELLRGGHGGKLAHHCFHAIAIGIWTGSTWKNELAGTSCFYLEDGIQRLGSIKEDLGNRECKKYLLTQRKFTYKEKKCISSRKLNFSLVHHKTFFFKDCLRIWFLQLPPIRQCNQVVLRSVMAALRTLCLRMVAHRCGLPSYFSSLENLRCHLKNETCIEKSRKRKHQIGKSKVRQGDVAGAWRVGR